MSGVEYPQSLQALLRGAAVSLGDWFAEPLGLERARHLAGEVRRRLQRAYSGGESAFEGRLLELVAAYWGERSPVSVYRSLEATVARDGRERALLELTWGQLLLSRRLEPAFVHLDAGFSRAAHLLSADDYFKVMKRHALLRLLPLSRSASAPQTLSALLDEARIIQRIGGDRTRPAGAGLSHGDTVD